MFIFLVKNKIIQSPENKKGLISYNSFHGTILIHWQVMDGYHCISVTGWSKKMHELLEEIHGIFNRLRGLETHR